MDSFNRSPRLNVDNISIWCIYFLFRNNCFGLSVEDSLGCCRQCMMIRQTKTNWLSMLSNIAVGIIHRLYVLIVYVYDLCLYTLCVWEEIGDVLHGLGEDRGWTSKPGCVWHWCRTTMCIKCWLWKCLDWFDIALKCISLSIVKYRSVSMLC